VVVSLKGEQPKNREKSPPKIPFFSIGVAVVALLSPPQQGEILSVDRCFASEEGVLLNYRWV
jgi:hypothetical protein